MVRHFTAPQNQDSMFFLLVLLLALSPKDAWDPVEGVREGTLS